jgi:hypothetical protein
LLAATVHPSAVLRERNNRDQAYQLFADDLRGLRAVIRRRILVAQAVSDNHQSVGSYTDSAVSTLSSTGSSSPRPHAATIRATIG